MIVGGNVFRVVTPSHPGCPKLDAAGAPCIRTEYLANCCEPWEWTAKKEAAHFFARHLDAENAAAAVGSRCHACVARPPDAERLPERLQPLPSSTAAPAVRPVARRARARKKAAAAIPRIDPFRLAQLRRDPVEASS